MVRFGYEYPSYLSNGSDRSWIAGAKNLNRDYPIGLFAALVKNTQVQFG
jgi:hypothetical protein